MKESKKEIEEKKRAEQAKLEEDKTPSSSSYSETDVDINVEYDEEDDENQDEVGSINTDSTVDIQLRMNQID